VKSKIPKLRFPKFNDRWNTKKISEIGKIITGSTPSTSREEYYNGNKQFVSPIDINDSRYVEDTKTKLTELGFNKGRFIRPFSILFVCIGSTIGKVAQNKQGCITNQQINSIVPHDEFDCDFIFTLLEKYSSKIKMLAATQAVPIINKSTFAKVKLALPTFPEQQKIASFLTAVDDKIQQLTKKKELLEKYKKGVMQKIFPSTSSGQAPEIRFKPALSGAEVDDDGNDYPDWERKKLGDLLDYIQPTDFIVNSTEYEDSNKIPVLTAGKTFILGYTNEEFGVFEEPLPVIIFDDFTTANQFVDFKFKVKSSAMKILIAKEHVNIKFVYEAMQMIHFSLGGEHKRFWISEYQFNKVKVPTSEEQQKIADFLSSIDKKIDSVNTQLEKTKEFKKELLQQMFV